jgi:hypothetical protein
MFGRFSVLVLLIVSAPSPATVVQRYLMALRASDHARMNVLWAHDVVSESRDGSLHQVDRERMRSMRGFEQAMHTKWSWAIVSVAQDSVTVRLTEENDLYRTLGSGTCTQTVVYVVSDGHINRIRTTNIAYSGRPFPETFRPFESWLLSTDAASDPELVREAHMRFTSVSAQHLDPWLRKWQDRNAR